MSPRIDKRFVLVLVSPKFLCILNSCVKTQIINSKEKRSVYRDNFNVLRNLSKQTKSTQLKREKDRVPYGEIEQLLSYLLVFLESTIHNLQISEMGKQTSNAMMFFWSEQGFAFLTSKPHTSVCHKTTWPNIFYTHEEHLE